MSRKLLYVILFFCLVQITHSQENGVVALDLPVRNSLKFNRYVVNPTFSFVREQNKYVTFSNKRQWVQFENAPQAYLFGYSGRFGENIGAGVGLFQQDFGIQTTFGGVLNFAYNAVLNRDNNLTFGLNIGAYQSGINEGNVISNEQDPALQNIPKYFLLTVNPGINYGTAFFDFGLSINNLVSYNLNTSKIIEENPEQSLQAHVMYNGYMDTRGFFDESKFSTMISAEFKEETTVFSGLAMLTIPKGIWGQVGYNTLYGASAGIGLNLSSQIALEYNYEQSIGELSGFGTSHEFTVAYRFKNNNRYIYSGDDEEKSVFTPKRKKRTIAKRRPSTTKPTTARTRTQVPDDQRVNQNETQETTVDNQTTKGNATETSQETTSDTNTEATNTTVSNNEENVEDTKASEEEILRKQQEEARAKAAEIQRQKEEAERLKAEAEEKARIRAEEAALRKQQEEARAKAAEIQRQKEEAERLKAEAEENARIRAEEEALKKQQEEERAKAAEAQKQKEEAERLKAEAEEKARIEAEAEALKQKQEEERLEAQRKTDSIAAISAGVDAETAKSINDINTSAEASKASQRALLTKLTEKVAVKQKDLDDLKEENDLSEQGIYVAPKPFKSVSKENAEIENLKDELEKVIEEQRIRIEELETVYIVRKRKVRDDKDPLNAAYLKAINELKAQQLLTIKAKADLEAELVTINVATEEERKRRIKRAAYDNQKDRFKKDSTALANIKKFTDVSTSTYTEDDFDFGDAGSNNNIQIVKNVSHSESGYYMVVAIHDTEAKRDEFLKKVVASGRKDVNFFFDVNTNKYFIYYSKFDDIGQAQRTLNSKESLPYNAKMSIVKIEN